MMAEKMDEKEVVSSEELLMAQMIQLDTISELLIEKGIITEKEFVSKLKQVQSQYETRRAVTRINRAPNRPASAMLSG